jgi:1-acyl-sn-glycerol-3-phosphate acyltransferase
MRTGPSYRLARALFRPPVRAAMRRTWSGGDLLPSEGGVLVAANHLSVLDPLLVADFIDAYGREPRFLAKSELFALPVVGSVLRDAGQIPVVRNSTQAARATDDATAAIRRGECVVVYPEGTLTRDPQLWPMAARSGAARVALATRCPLLPLAHWGIQDVLGPYTRRFRPLPRRTVQIVLGRPVDLDDLYGRPVSAAVLDDATARLMAAITALLEGLRGESAPALGVGPATMGGPPPADRSDAPEERQRPDMDTGTGHGDRGDA